MAIEDDCALVQLTDKIQMLINQAMAANTSSTSSFLMLESEKEKVLNDESRGLLSHSTLSILNRYLKVEKKKETLRSYLQGTKLVFPILEARIKSEIHVRKNIHIYMYF